MEPLMVSVTEDPRKTAPTSSMTNAMPIACLSEREPEPTDVANALATSLDPMPTGGEGGRGKAYSMAFRVKPPRP